MRAIAIAVLLILPLGGCSAESTITCADFVDYPTPADAASDAGLIVVGTVEPSTGGRLIYGEFAPVHRVSVQTVLAGELPTGSMEIDVAAAPLTCNGEAGAFPDGDPLDVDGRVELFLFEENGEYRLLTPWDGVIAAPEGEPLPWVPEG